MEERLKMSYENEMKEADKRISERMQEGFDITSDTISIRKLVNMVKNGELHDAPYQRGDVWDAGRKKALIESIIRYGGKKVPTLTFRRLNDGTMEIVDGKQRLLSSIMPFVNNEFSLSGVSTPEFTGYKLKDIEENYPFSYSAFMTTEVPVQILSKMSNEDAIVYFHQVNSSGVQMNTGEKIHAMQDTPILKAIESLTTHNVWDNIRYVSRYNDYEYVAKMLLFVRDSDASQGIFNPDMKHKILLQLDAYRSTDVPPHIVKSVGETLEFLGEVFDKYKFKLTIREFYDVFVYANIYLDSLNVHDFGKFIKELYYFIHETNEAVEFNIFRVIKDKHTEKGYWYTSEYYKWLCNTFNRLYGRFVKGEDWNEIKKFSVR